MEDKIGCILAIITFILGTILHVWTTVIAFSTSGISAAVITFILPGFSEIFWVVTIWKDVHTVMNPYLLAYIASWIFCIISSIVNFLFGTSDN
jgi:hypothetical protein